MSCYYNLKISYREAIMSLTDDLKITFDDFADTYCKGTEDLSAYRQFLSIIPQDTSNLQRLSPKQQGWLRGDSLPRVVQGLVRVQALGIFSPKASSESSVLPCLPLVSDLPPLSPSDPAFGRLAMVAAYLDWAGSERPKSDFESPQTTSCQISLLPPPKKNKVLNVFFEGLLACNWLKTSTRKQHYLDFFIARLVSCMNGTRGGARKHRERSFSAHVLKCIEFLKNPGANEKEKGIAMTLVDDWVKFFLLTRVENGEGTIPVHKDIEIAESRRSVLQTAWTLTQPPGSSLSFRWTKSKYGSSGGNSYSFSSTKPAKEEGTSYGSHVTINTAFATRIKSIA